MRIAIRLCIKDLGHYWPYIALWNLLIVVRALFDVLQQSHPQLLILRIAPVALFVSFLMWLVCCLITALGVPADSSMGDRQFWVTRPISWQNLLAGKILFLICAINLPVLIVQSVDLLVNGFSPLHKLAVLGEEQLSLLAILAVAAILASVTRNLAQFAIGMLILYAGNFGLLLLVDSAAVVQGSNWGSAESIHSLINSAPLVLFSALLLLLLYSQRTTRSVIIVAIFLVISFSLNELAYYHSVKLWHTAAEFRARIAGILRSRPPVSVVFGHKFPTRYREPIIIGLSEQRAAALELVIPVRVTGIPMEHELINERMNFTVIAPNGSVWKSGWIGYGGVRGRPINQFNNTPAHGILADGDYWMAAKVDQRFYEKIQDAAVRIRVSLAFRLAGPPDPITFQEDSLTFVSNGNGRYGKVLQQDRVQTVVLFTELPCAILAYDYLTATGSNTSIWRYINSRAIAGGPWEDPSSNPMRQEEAWFETTLDIQNVRLSDYSLSKNRSPEAIKSKNAYGLQSGRSGF